MGSLIEKGEQKRYYSVFCLPLNLFSFLLWLVETAHFLSKGFMCVIFSNVNVRICVWLCVSEDGSLRKSEASDPLELVFQAVVTYLCGWEPTSGPLNEQHTLFTTEPSLQCPLPPSFLVCESSVS